jgi:hypothetical protein
MEGDLEIRSFAHLEGPSEDFLKLPRAVEGLDDDQAAAEEAGTRALLDERNTYWHNAEARSFLVSREGRVVARLTAFHNRSLVEKGRTVGLVGLFSGVNDSGAVQALVEGVSDWFRARGVGKLRGPMAGDIWHRWRFMTRGFETTPFPGEPRQPAYYPELFLAAGFSPVRRYTSKRIDDLEAQLALFGTAEALNRKRGFRFRGLDRSRWEDELESLWQLCSHSFATTWCVTPTTREEFFDIYDRWLRRVGPDSIRLALDRDRRVAGLGLAVTSPEDTLNIRTIAVLPDQHGYGLGQAIAAELYRRALESGQKTVHHCLMGPLTPPQRYDHGLGVVTREYEMYERSID